MVDHICDEIQKALDNNLYFAALSLSLTLPDICGKVAYPQSKTGSRYISWYDTFVGKHFHDIKAPDNSILKVDGNLIYKLRCSMLHEGSPGIKKSASACNLDFFSLVAIPKNSYALHSTISCEISKSANGKTLYSIGINIRSLCEIMMIVAREYYHKHAQDFHFNCEIVDLNEYYAKR